jgi:hypothetical protein
VTPALFLFALSLAAVPLRVNPPDLADLQVRVTTRTSASENVYFTIAVTVANAGPDAARDVVLNFAATGLTILDGPCSSLPCAVGDLAAGSEKTFEVLAEASRYAAVTYTATARSRTPDPIRGNESVTRIVDLATAPDLEPVLDLLPDVDPNLPFFGFFNLRNHGYSSIAHDVVATIDLPPGVSVLSAPERYCKWTAVRLTCNIPSFGYGQGRDTQYGLPLKFMAPPRYEGGTLEFQLSMTALEQDGNDENNRAISRTTLYRTFLVTTTADDGEGSLRAAVTASSRIRRATPAISPARCSSGSKSLRKSRGRRSVWSRRCRHFLPGGYASMEIHSPRIPA